MRSRLRCDCAPFDVRAALSAEFADAWGQCFDNDAGQFASPHPDALNAQKSREVVRAVETALAALARQD